MADNIPIISVQVTGRCDFSDPLDDISAPDIVPTNTISLDDEYGLGAATEPVVVDSISLLFVARRKTVYGVSEGNHMQSYM